MRRTGSATASASCSRETVRQRGLGGDEGFEIVVAVIAAAGADCRPFGVGGRSALGPRGGLAPRRRERRCRAAYRGAPRWRAAVGRSSDLRPRFAVVRTARPARPWRRPARPPAFVFRTPLEQRIALEFGLDIGDQIEIGELQQLDRLHQLRRHHQRLALADFEVFG